MVDLSQVMKTRYMTMDHVNRLRNELDKIIGQEVDLAKCRFTPQSEQVLAQYYGKIKFCNSVSKELDDLLQRNYKAALTPRPMTVKLSPDLTDRGKLIENMAALNTNDIYECTEIMNPRMQAFIVLTMMRRPKVKFYLDTGIGVIFDIVRKYWLPSEKPHSKYWELSGAACVVRETPDDYVSIIGDGILSKAMYTQKYKVLPYEFGTENTYDNPEFGMLRETMLDRLKSVKHKRSMKDLVRKGAL